jgi:ABC-type sugar transport system permease subunit
VTTTSVDQAAEARRKPGRGSRFGLRDASEARLAFWLLIPTFVLLLLIVGFPILRAVYLSLFSDNRFGTPPADIGGIVNAITHTDILWTGSKGPARWAIIIADTWKTAPFIGLLLLAGLQIIPDELYEAAKVDGATAWQRFRRITLPLLKSSILVAVLFRMLDVLRIFDLPKILTNGANGTSTLSILAYEQSIERVRVHYGSALSVLTFLYIMLVAFVFVKLLGTSVVKTQAREVK